jgi:hypothetical protein
MKRTLFFAMVVLFLLAVPFAAMAVTQVGGGDGGKGGTPVPVVVTPDHTQCLGGQATHDHNWWGLVNAAEHSRVIRWILRAS